MLLPPGPLPAQQSYGGLVTGLAYNFLLFVTLILKKMQ
jgi:hypothetical protein